MTNLVQTWLDRLLATDLEGLVDLYEPEASMRALSETYCGRDEIEDGFAMARRFIKDATIDVVNAIDASRIAFDTTVRGKIGRAHVRHTWTLHAGRIRDHVAELVGHDKTA